MRPVERSERPAVQATSVLRRPRPTGRAVTETAGGGGRRRASRLARGGDRLDLDELVGVAEERDAEQRARRAPEALRDHGPGAHEIRPLTGDDVDRRLQEVVAGGARLR